MNEALLAKEHALDVADRAIAAADYEEAEVRGKRTPMTVSSTPFTPNGYFRG